MAGKLSAKAQRELAALEEARRKWDRVHSLVEKAGSERSGQGLVFRQIRRASEDVGRIFINNGFTALAEATKRMALLTRRGASVQTKVRGMREIVGVVGTSIERTAKALKDKDEVRPED